MKTTLKHILLFVFLLLIIPTVNNIIKSYLISQEIQEYNTLLLVKTISNLILSIISFVCIKKLNLSELGGLRNKKTEKKRLLIFPLLYLVALNLVFADDIPNFTISNLIVLSIYCLSIGFSEELSLRSVLLPLFIKHFGNDKKSVVKAIVIAAVVFGLLHLIKFDKGIYGELSQLCFATFIGVLFGALLITTKRIYPLIIIHSLIDFAAKIDTIGIPFQAKTASETEISGAIFSVIFTLPCLLYGIYIMRKHIPQELSNTTVKSK